MWVLLAVAIVVIQRDAARHLGHVGLTVIIVAIDELRAQARRQLLPDMRLATARHPHDHQTHATLSGESL